MEIGRRAIPFWAVFAIGLAVRLGLMLFATPWTHAHWFAPFLESIAQNPSADPWTAFLARGGDPMSFPYGPVYILAYGPLTWLGHALSGADGAAFGLRFSVLAFDIALMLVMRRLSQDRDLAATLYWLSPIAIYVNYWHGQLDVLPTLILMLALVILHARRFFVAGAAFAASVAAKFSMVLAAPFVAIYLIGGGRFAGMRWRAAATLALGALICAPILLSPGFRDMVLGTPEVERLYKLAIPVQDGIRLFALPVALLAFFYVCWRVRRFNFNMLVSAIGAAFLCLILLTPPAPGWTMWVLPFLTLHMVRFRGAAMLIGAVFSVLFLVFHITVSTGATLATGEDWTLALGLGLLGGERLHSILYSLYFMAGFALLAQMFWRGIFTDPYYLATRRPLVIGIAGDSGTGKDTLADAVEAMFDVGASSKIAGDDYHHWDRNKPMWRALTHLNPRANDLEQFDADVLALAAGRPVRARHYDHAVGTMTKPRDRPSREIVIAHALHALHNPGVCAAYDLKIFLDMDESLRRDLKVKRDVTKRGHAPEVVLESIERRAMDGGRYIRPQRDAADVVLSLTRAPHAAIDGECGGALRLKVLFRHGADADALTRVLIAACGLDVSPSAAGDGVLICGEPTARDVAAAARALAPDFRAFLALDPRWRAGMTGVMQLIVLRELTRVVRKRAFRS